MARGGGRRRRRSGRPRSPRRWRGWGVGGGGGVGRGGCWAWRLVCGGGGGGRQAGAGQAAAGPSPPPTTTNTSIHPTPLGGWGRRPGGPATPARSGWRPAVGRAAALPSGAASRRRFARCRIAIPSEIRVAIPSQMPSRDSESDAESRSKWWRRDGRGAQGPVRALPAAEARERERD